MTDPVEMKPGLVLFRRTDVKHQNWYCRLRIPGEDRYKTVSLKTPHLELAKERALDAEADLRFRLKHDVPVFNKPFSQVAREFSDHQKIRSEVGQITHHRWRVMNSHIRSQLNRYVGSQQITLIGQDKWTGYPIWRKQTGSSRFKDENGDTLPPSDGTIRDEMATFRAIMRFAASKKYIRNDQVFSGKLPLDKNRRDEFSPEEYRHLQHVGRKTGALTSDDGRSVKFPAGWELRGPMSRGFQAGGTRALTTTGDGRALGNARVPWDGS